MNKKAASVLFPILHKEVLSQMLDILTAKCGCLSNINNMDRINVCITGWNILLLLRLQHIHNSNLP